MHSESSGSKMSTSEYAARKLIDVAAKVAVPTITFVGIVYGPAIVESAKQKYRKIKTAFSTK